MRRYRSIFAVCAVLTFILPAISAQIANDRPASTVRSRAPLNPRFVEYLNGLAQGHRPAEVSPEGHRLGLIPSPIDFSHLKTQPNHALQFAIALPPSYDLRLLGKVTPVKNQLLCGDCWAFATLGSMESNLLTAETWNFSENNLNNLNGFDIGVCQGGNGVMSMAYLARWAGPIAAFADPDPTHCTNANSCYNLSPQGLPPQKHVQDVIIIAGRTSATDNANLKTAVMTYGGVYTTMNAELLGGASNTDWNNSTSAFYYNGASPACTSNGQPVPCPSDHAVTLVGWDDNYSATNFSTTPPGNGAFLIKNSWGTSFGQQGYFWISYYDKMYAYDESYVFNGNQAVTNYSREYEYDPLGWTTPFGVSNTGSFANVFQATASELLQAVATYVISNNSPYVISVYTGVTGGPITGTLAGTTSGTFDTAGYHTVVLPTPVGLTAGQKFSVVVQLTTPGSNSPIPLEYPLAGFSSKASASPGQSYVLWNNAWTDITSWGSGFENTNVALKAFSGTSVTTYTLTLNKTGSGSGTVTSLPPGINCGPTCAVTFNAGTAVTLTATPAPYFMFAGWSGRDSTSTNTCHIAMNSDRSVSATFNPAISLRLLQFATSTLPGRATPPISVELLPSPGLNASVQLSCSGLPAGATCNFLPPSPVALAGNPVSTSLRINTSQNTPCGLYRVRIAGSALGVPTAYVTLRLQVGRYFPHF